MWLLLLAGAALLYYLKPKETADALTKLIPAKLQGMGVTPNWPKQSVAAFESGKHYFFALPITDDMSAPRRLASFTIALTLMGFKDVKAFPAGSAGTGQLMATADSPHPSDWVTYNGVRCSGTWAGSSGQTFNFDLTKPFGGTTATVWMSTEDFTAMHAMANR